MEIINKTIDDLLVHLEFIRREIPAKHDLDEEQIRLRLENKMYGVLIAREENSSITDSFIGLTVWYEENKQLYLWLGAFKKKNAGYATKILEHIKQTTNYSIWFSKTSEDNSPALNVLKKFGFEIHDTKDGICILKKYTT